MAWSGTPPNPPADSRGLALEKEAQRRIGIERRSRTVRIPRMYRLTFWALTLVGFALLMFAVFGGFARDTRLAVDYIALTIFLTGLALNFVVAWRYRRSEQSG